jgi:hypothetical protein
MKKPLLILFFIFFIINSAYAISTVDELVEHCKQSPEKLGNWIVQHIWYKEDMAKWGKREYYQSPSETLSKDNKFKLQSGDCEDYAILAYACLLKLGYEPKLMVLYTRTTAHCICVFLYKKKWCLLGVEYLTVTDATSYEGIRKFYNNYYNKKYKWHYLINESKIPLN